MILATITYRTRGPLFNGLIPPAIEDAVDATEEKTAKFGAAIIRARMNTTFRVQTPYYRPMNQARGGAGHWEINDNGIIYGPWLEGTGSRNKTTRFKGYFIYRKSRQEIQRHMERIGEIEVDQALKRVGA